MPTQEEIDELARRLAEYTGRDWAKMTEDSRVFWRNLAATARRWHQ